MKLATKAPTWRLSSASATLKSTLGPSQNRQSHTLTATSEGRVMVKRWENQVEVKTWSLQSIAVNAVTRRGHFFSSSSASTKHSTDPAPYTALV